MTNSAITDIISTTSQSFVYFIILFFYHKALNCKKKPALLLVIFSFFCFFFLWLMTYSPWILNLLSYQIRMALRTILINLTIAIFCFLLCSAPMIKKVQFFALFNLSTLVSEGLYLLFIKKVLSIDAVDALYVSDWRLQLLLTIIASLFYLLFFTLTYFLFKRKKLSIDQKTSAVFLITAMVLGCACFLFSLIIYNGFKPDKASQDFYSTALLVFDVLLCSAIMFILYKASMSITKYNVLQEKMFWSEKTQELQKEYYDNISKKNDDIRKIRHDFKDQLSTIRALISDRTEKSNSIAIELINELNDTLDSTRSKIYTENPIVNAVIGIKTEEYSKYEIDWDIKLDLPKALEGIESYELSSFFINLLNNAIEACIKLSLEERKIYLHSAYRSGYLIIKVENSFERIEKDAKGKLVSTKEDKQNHGIGTVLISDIVDKYKGTYKTEVEGKTFKTVITLPCQATP